LSMCQVESSGVISIRNSFFYLGYDRVHANHGLSE
jgi:hypothetical protein